MVLDDINGRNRLLLEQNDKIISVDLATGARSIFATGLKVDDSAVLDPVTNKLYVIAPQGLEEVDLLTGQHYFNVDFYGSRLLLDDSSTSPRLIQMWSDSGHITEYDLVTRTKTEILNPNPGMPNDTRAIAIDKTRSRYIVLQGNNGLQPEARAIYAADKITNARTVFSSNAVGTGPLFGRLNGETAFSSIAIDEANQRALVTETGTGVFYAIDLASGNRSIFSENGGSTMANANLYIKALVLNKTNGYAYYVGRGATPFIGAVDVMTGHRVIVSKKATP